MSICIHVYIYIYIYIYITSRVARVWVERPKERAEPLRLQQGSEGIAPLLVRAFVAAAPLAHLESG